MREVSRVLQADSRPDGVVSAAGMPIILWSADPLDWKVRDADLTAERIAEASAGMIDLAHDIHDTTVAAIPALSNLSRAGACTS